MCTELRATSKTILLVDDNEDVREFVGVVLRNRGYTVCEAENGRDALDQLEAMRKPPCLLLLDLMMPVMTGPEMLEVLRKRNLLASIPVVVISAGGEPSHAPGAKMFIRKPADTRLLLDVVHQVCGAPDALPH